MSDEIISAQTKQICIVLVAMFAIALLYDRIPVHPSFSFYWAVFLPVIATVCAVTIEILTIGIEKSSVRQLIIAQDDQSTGYDTFFYLVHLLGIWAWLPLVVSLGLITYAADFHDSMVAYGEAKGFGLATGILPVDVLVFAVLWTFFDYWNHRIVHMQPLWYFHRMHHSATNLTLFTATRNNPIAYVVEPFIRVWPFVLFMPDVITLTCFIALNHTYQLLVHSRIQTDWGWFGRWVMVSPAAHRVHHSCNPEHYGKNLAMATLWDKIFGTWIGADHGEIELGVKESKHNSGNLIRDIYIDIWMFFRESVGMLRGLVTSNPTR